MKMKNHKKAKMNIKVHVPSPSAAIHLQPMSTENIAPQHPPANLNTTTQNTTQNDSNTNVIEKNVMDTTNKIEKIITTDIDQHSKQLVKMCIHGMDHVAQNKQFATDIMKNFFTNCNLIADDIWAICAQYINESIACRNIEGYHDINLNTLESLMGIVKQCNLVNSQITLDCFNEVVIPSMKQGTDLVEELKKCYIANS